jgi:hypothetical protein
MTGVGTMAAYLVGGPGGFGGFNGQLDNSLLLRERIASNASLAGEQELNSLAFNENIVVSVPGNTRFFIVLLQGSGEQPPARTAPANNHGATQLAADAGSAPGGPAPVPDRDIRMAQDFAGHRRRARGRLVALSAQSDNQLRYKPLRTISPLATSL